MKIDYIAMVLLTLWISIACSSLPVQDESISSLEAGYHTAGFLVSDHAYSGIGSFRQNSVSPFRFTVLGIGSGEIRINPEPCAAPQARRYEDSGDVSFEIYSGDVETCLIQITVQPDYIRGEVQRPLTGLIALSFSDVDEGPSHLTFANQVYTGVNERVVLPAPFDHFKVFVSGCGQRLKRRPKAKSANALYFNVKSDERVCILHGFVRDARHKAPDMAIQGIVTRYRQGYEPLAAPKIQGTGKDLRIQAGPEVNRIATKNGIVRGITSKGRAFYCSIPSEGEPECL